MNDANITPLGITFSTIEELRQWRDEAKVPGELLSDADRTVAMRYGAAEAATQAKAARISVLVGPNARVIKPYDNVDPANHAADVLRDLADRNVS